MSLTKATYSMIEGAPANVRDYGAVGDGIANDSAAIQAAVDAVAAAGGGSVWLPAGTYLLNSAPVAIKDNVTLDGRGGGVLKQGTAANAITATSVSGFNIIGVTFVGSGAASSVTSTTDNAVYANECTNFRVVGCDISDFAHFGVRAVNSTEFSIEDNYIHDMVYVPATNFADISVTQYLGGTIPENFQITNNRCTSTTDVGIILGIARNFIVSGNISNNHQRHGIVMYQPGAEVRGTISGNTCANNGWVGIYINGQLTTGNACYITVADNVCYQNGGTYTPDPTYQFSAGISLYQTNGVTVTGNIIRDNSAADTVGINLFAACTNCVVANNIIDTVTAHGINLEQTIRNCSITNNTIHSAGLDGIYMFADTAQCRIIGNHIKNSGNFGINSDGDAVLVNKNNIISSNTVLSSYKYGIYMAFSENTVVSNNCVLDNSQIDTAAGNFDGIYIAECENVTLSANMSGNTSVGVGQRGGITVTGSSPSLPSMSGNIFANNRTFNYSGEAPVNNIYARKGNTGGRPVPSATQTGTMYLDTTLDADGKPIWWNGTAWVDATGAVV